MRTALALLFCVTLSARAAEPISEFIADTMPTPSCHASTIVESGGGLLASWFGGKSEGDKSVTIWLARKPASATNWEKPVEVATGIQEDRTREPCWNPVLFQPTKGPLMLFYKVGPSPSKWWGMLITSSDAGKTWSEPTRLPKGILGPIKNKPIELADGTIVSPSSTEHDGWRLHMESSKDLGKTWETTGPLNDKSLGAIQPTLLRLPDGKLELLARPRSAGLIQTAVSKDAGKTWSGLASLNLPNPNSGIDAVTLKDGRHVLIYNHTVKGRSPLNVAVSANGLVWKQAMALESAPGEYSYPAVIQTADGKVHVTYTWKRQKVKHIIIDPESLPR